MENQPKKSKALIVTIIILIVVLSVVGFMIYKNKKTINNNGVLPSSETNFSSLPLTKNATKQIENNTTSDKIITKTGEEIKKVEQNKIISPVSTKNKCPNGSNNPPLCTTISDGICRNGATNPPICNEIVRKCANSAENPPLCTTINNKCQNGANNPPVCDVY